MWAMGHPATAQRDVDRAIRDARQIGHMPTLMQTLTYTVITQICLSNYAAANAQADEVLALD